MRLRTAFSVFLSLIAVSCTYEEVITPEESNDNSPIEFYATIDDQPDADTKVYADDQLRVLWNADDRITIFNKNTYNQQYRFTGDDGDNAGGFKKVPSDDEFVTSNPLDDIYAVYPYQENTKISNGGVISTSIPSAQTYKENSFGVGANVMVTKSETNMLKFKNVGGYLSLKFYGAGVSVSSITLKSNNGELIAGDCTVDMTSGSPVSSLITSQATDEITLTCPSPVELGSTASEATQFIFVLSPVTLAEGFTVLLTTSDGEVIEESSAKSRLISRSTLTRLGAIMIDTNHYGGEPLGTVAEAIDLGLSVKWASWNVGASKVDDYGGLFGAGDGSGSLISTSRSDYYYNEGESICGTEYDLAHNLWGGAWRMPTKEELDELFDSCTLEETTVDGVFGVYATGPSGASIFLPYAGNRQGTYIYERGSHGHYWSGDAYSEVHYNGYYDVDILNGSVEQREGCWNWIGQSIRPVLAVSVPEAIDLGLPSGIKWGSHNVGASSPEGTGDFFAWGEIAPRAEVPGGAYAWAIYKWCNGEYANMLKYNTNPSYGDVDGRTVLEKEDDAAASSLGGYWRMPTAEEQDELLKYCTWNWSSRGDVYGYEVVSNINGNSIFLPASGYKGDDSYVSEAGEVGLYWSSSLTRRSEVYTAYRLRFAEGEIEQSDINRSFALQIRPVWEEFSIPEVVDMGLSVKWANMNLGALTPEGTGSYYAWGETIPKESYEWDTYKWCNGSESSLTKYCLLADYGEVDGVSALDCYDDVVRGKLGGSWRMPTWEEFIELRDSPYCTWTWTVKNGIHGFEVVSSITNGKVFFPAAGQMYGTSVQGYDVCGGYYASTLDDDSLSGPLASHLYFLSNDPHGGGGFRYIGRVIRPVFIE